MNTFRLNLDLDKRFENDWVRIRQGDKNGTTIIATIYDHGVLLTGSYTARIRMRLPDGEHFYEKDATFSNGVATVTIDETQAASASGTTDNAYFQILSGSTVIASTQDFTVRVLRDATSDAGVGENYSTQIQQAIDSLNDMTATIPEKVVDEVDAQLAAHPEWTTTVQDNSLDDDKLIQKGGILQREQWLETMLPNIPRKTTAESDVHSVTDSAGGGPLGIEVYGRSTQDGTPTPDSPVPIQSVTPQLLDPVGISASNRGLTATYEGQGWFRVSGTATGSGAALLLLWGSTNQTQYMLPAGSYAFTYEAEDMPTTIQFQCLSTVGSDTNKPWQLSMSGAFTMSCDGISRVCLLIGGGLAAGTVVDGRVRISCYEGDVPHGWGNGAALAAHGRNMLNPKLVYEGTLTTIERSEDGFRVRTAQNGIFRGASTGDTVNNMVNTLMALGLLRMGQTYTLSADVTVAAGTGFLSFRRSGSNVIAAMSAQVTSGTRHLSVTYTVTEDVYLSFFVTGSASAAGDVTFSNVQLELGGTEHAYQPYAETVIPIDLQGHAMRSLPDGTRDEVVVDAWGHAVLTQRVGHAVLDGSGDEGWRYSSSASYSDPTNGKYCYFTEPIFDANIRKGTTLFTSSMSSHYRFVTLSTLQANKEQGTCTFSAQDTHPSFTVITPYTTLADFTSWLAANPVTVDYKLATPVTIDLGHLDPALLPAPDLTAYVVPSAPSVLRYGYAVAESTSSNLAPTETSPATASHAVGTLLTLDGQLVKVTSAIAVGEAVTIGGNVRTTTIAAELAALA